VEAFDPTTQDGMRMLTINAMVFCRKELETSGDFEQHFGLRVGNETQDFKLSTRAAASSLTRIFEEAHKAARRAQANTLILMLRRPMATVNNQLAIEKWDSIFVVTQTERRITIAMLPFRKTDSGFEFEELQKEECETETFATPQVIFQKLGYVADAGALDDTRRARGRECIWN
jgi:hypothetical protein